jgi:hypothetical protein
MIKVVEWGRSAVGAFFIVLGVDMLVASTIHVPGLMREHSREATYTFVLGRAFLLWLPALFCAWGVFKCRAWARKLGLALCAFFTVAGSGLSVDLRLAGRVDTPLLVMALVACAVFVWLILPAVRAEYFRRNQIA